MTYRPRNRKAPTPRIGEKMVDGRSGEIGEFQRWAPTPHGRYAVLRCAAGVRYVHPRLLWYPRVYQNHVGAIVYSHTQNA